MPYFVAQLHKKGLHKVELGNSAVHKVKFGVCLVI